MTTARYAEKLVKLIEGRPPQINLDKLLYEVYVRAKISEARRDREQGHWLSNEEVMEEMWARISSTSAGRVRRTGTSK